MTKEEMKEFEERIKEQVLNELLETKRKESYIIKSNKALNTKLAELGFEPWIVYRIISAINVFRKACAKTKQLSKVSEQLADDVATDCLEVLKRHYKN